MSDLNEKLSILVRSQLPDFVQENNETFVSFLKAYYEYLEQDEKAQRVLQSARSYSDIDITIDSFVDYFLEQFAYGIPEYIFDQDETSAKRFLVKYIGSLYRSKGSPNALKFLFRLAFDEEIDVIFPYDFLFKPSDGKYNRVVYVRVRAESNANVQATINKTIYGEQSLIKTGVDFITKLSDDTYDLFFEETTLFSSPENFIIGERLISGGNVGANITVLGNLTEIKINDGGLGYTLTDSITSSDSNITLTISAIDDRGSIKKVDILSPTSEVLSPLTLTYGFGSDTRNAKYELTSNIATVIFDDDKKHGLEIGDTVNVSVLTGTLPSNNYVVSDVLTNRVFRLTAATANTSGNLTLTYRKQANLSPVIGSVTRGGRGYGISLDGQLNTNIVIQDSLKWQQFSYVIRSDLNVDTWATLVKEVLHPAGLALFGEVTLFSQSGDIESIYAGPVNTPQEAYILFVAQLINDFAIPVKSSTPEVFYTLEVQLPPRLIDSTTSRYSAGATLQTIDKFKFEYGNAFPINIITSDNFLTVQDFALFKNIKSKFQPPSFVDNLNREASNANIIYTMSINT